MSKTKHLINLISLLKSKNSIRSVCFQSISGKSFICVRSYLGLAFLIFSEDPWCADVESWIYICPLIIYYLPLRCVSISAAKEHNVKIRNLIKVWRINACVSLHLWGALGGAVRPNSALTASTTRLWMVFRRTSSHMSDGASAWSFRVSGSRPDGSAVPSLSSRLCRCRCPRILPPCTVSLWVVGCKDMGESDRVGSWRWRAPGLKGEGARCCMIAGSVRMWLKGDKFIIRHTSQRKRMLISEQVGVASITKTKRWAPPWPCLYQDPVSEPLQGTLWTWWLQHAQT